MSSEQRGTISVFDAASRRIVRTIDLTKSFDIPEPVQAIEMRATKRRTPRLRRHGALQPGGRDRSRDRRRRPLLPDRRAHRGIGLSPDETRLYAASGLSGTLTIIDIVGNKVLTTVDLGGRPWGALAARK